MVEDESRSGGVVYRRDFNGMHDIYQAASPKAVRLAPDQIIKSHSADADIPVLTCGSWRLSVQSRERIQSRDH